MLRGNGVNRHDRRNSVDELNESARFGTRLHPIRRTNHNVQRRGGIVFRNHIRGAIRRVPFGRCGEGFDSRAVYDKLDRSDPDIVDHFRCQRERKSANMVGVGRCRLQQRHRRRFIRDDIEQHVCCRTSPGRVGCSGRQGVRDRLGHFIKVENEGVRCPREHRQPSSIERKLDGAEPDIIRGVDRNGQCGASDNVPPRSRRRERNRGSLIIHDREHQGLGSRAAAEVVPRDERKSRADRLRDLRQVEIVRQTSIRSGHQVGDDLAVDNQLYLSHPNNRRDVSADRTPGALNCDGRDRRIEHRFRRCIRQVHHRERLRRRGGISRRIPRQRTHRDRARSVDDRDIDSDPIRNVFGITRQGAVDEERHDRGSGIVGSGGAQHQALTLGHRGRQGVERYGRGNGIRPARRRNHRGDDRHGRFDQIAGESLEIRTNAVFGSRCRIGGHAKDRGERSSGLRKGPCTIDRNRTPHDSGKRLRVERDNPCLPGPDGDALRGSCRVQATNFRGRLRRAGQKPAEGIGNQEAVTHRRRFHRIVVGVHGLHRTGFPVDEYESGVAARGNNSSVPHAERGDLTGDRGRIQRADSHVESVGGISIALDRRAAILLNGDKQGFARKQHRSDLVRDACNSRNQPRARWCGDVVHDDSVVRRRDRQQRAAGRNRTRRSGQNQRGQRRQGLRMAQRHRTSHGHDTFVRRQNLAYTTGNGHRRRE